MEIKRELACCDIHYPHYTAGAVLCFSQEVNTKVKYISMSLLTSTVLSRSNFMN